MPNETRSGMHKYSQVIDFIEDFMRWASRRADIRAAALVGSYARETAKETSDVDLVLIVADPQRYLSDKKWLRVFGVVIAKKIEDHGMVKSLRAWYENGLEIEFGFTTREWAQTPLDPGTRQVIEDGMRLLFEKEVLLSPFDIKKG